MSKEDKTRRAAVSLVERADGRMLCVWNRRYQGWSLPGGMVEDGETIEEAQRRELVEECGLETIEALQVFEGEHGLATQAEERPGRASVVHVFRVKSAGRPQAVERDCPIDWLTREDFVRRSPFGPFYRRVFEAVPPKCPHSNEASMALETEALKIRCTSCGAKPGGNAHERD